jgi:hypothetical protein
MYSIKPFHLQQAKKLGVSIKPSSKGNYKLDVFKDGEYVTSIGDKRYKDFMIYKEEKGEDYANERRRLYRLRHKKDGVRGQLAMFILW